MSLNSIRYSTLPTQSQIQTHQKVKKLKQFKKIFLMMEVVRLMADPVCVSRVSS